MWLSLSDRDLHRLVSYLYEGIGNVSPADEATRLALLASPTHPAWSGGVGLVGSLGSPQWRSCGFVVLCASSLVDDGHTLVGPDLMLPRWPRGSPTRECLPFWVS